MARVLVFTGDGKGKTTAALGLVLRAVGHDMRVYVMQFLKHDSTVGEYRALEAMTGVDVVQVGKGFVPPPDSPAFAAHKSAAEAGLETAARAFAAGEHFLYILDEICLAVALGLLREEKVSRLIRQAPPEACVVLTGRNASEGILELADTVTEMRCVRHGLASGIRAQKGVEK